MMEQIHITIMEEIQKKDATIKEHLNLIAEEEKRINFLENQKSQHQEKLEELTSSQKELKHTLNDKEKFLSELENKLEKNEEHFAAASTQAQLDALTKEKETLTPQHEEVEEEILAMLEKSEDLEDQIKGTKKFLEGIEKTIEEARNETSHEISKQNGIIESIESEQRVDLERLPAALQIQFNQLQKKYRFKSPIAFVENNACNQCFMNISRQQQTEILRSETTECCPNCGRILTVRT